MRYTAIYGGLAGAISIAVLVAGLVFDLPDHARSVWFGYLVMIVALSMIFVGVKRYRDVECGGVIGFRRAFVLGLGIAVVASIIYMVGWELCLGLSGKDFMADYTASVIESMRAKGASASQLQAKTAEMRELATQYRSPLFRLPMTFVEIFPVGLIIALFSATLLRNPRLLP